MRRPERALGGEWREADVSDPLGRPRRARVARASGRDARSSRRRRRSGCRSSPDELDPLAASSRGLGELIAAALADAPTRSLVGLGGTATVDGGAGLREVLGELPGSRPGRLRRRRPAARPRGAARVFGPQKGATPRTSRSSSARLAGRTSSRRSRALPGAGAAGGLGAALAALGAELVRGARARARADRVRRPARRRRPRRHRRGDGRHDDAKGKAPAAVARRRRVRVGVRCVVFGGSWPSRFRRASKPSRSRGDPARAREDSSGLAGRLVWEASRAARTRAGPAERAPAGASRRSRGCSSTSGRKLPGGEAVALERRSRR